MEPQHLPTKRVIRRCPFCGARINPDDTSCPVCGEALIQILSPRAATSSQTTSQPRQQLPPPRTLGRVRQQSLVSTKNSRESVRTAQSLTTHQRRSIRPIETIYVQCPSCGARNGVADMHCNVCGQMFSSVMPVSQGPLEDPPPIAMWSPRLLSLSE